MTTLITGGGGFVGINLAEILIAQGEQVVLFDRHGLPAPALQALQRGNIPPSIVTGDVRDAGMLAAVFKDFGIERVVHAAVITSDSARESRHPEDIIDINVQGTVNLLAAARAARCRRIVCISSGAAYGTTLYETAPVREEVSPSRPESLYGITKFAAEQIALRLASLWELDVICVRLGSVFGPWELDTGARDRLSPHFQLAQLALRGEAALLPSKEVRRDWVYSRDVASGLAALLQAPRPGHSSYHLSSGVAWEGAIADWCGKLRNAYPRFSWRMAAKNERPNVNYHADRDRASMDITRIAHDIGFTPRFGPHQAHADYSDWIRSNEAFMLGASTTPQ
jgi:UDP-glucuronate 4-epimerase